MTDQEKMEKLRRHIDERLAYLNELCHQHDYSISEPTEWQIGGHLMNLGERRALLEMVQIWERLWPQVEGRP